MIFRTCILIISLLLPQIAHAQQPSSPHQVSGVVVYQQRVNMTSMDIQMDTLRFNRIESIFYWNVANYQGSDSIAYKTLKNKFPNAQPAEQDLKGAPPRIYYGRRINLLNLKKDSLFSLIGMKYIGKLLYLKETIPHINWAIKDSIKNIGNYNVKKATTHFRGRDYTAWFTPEIPVPFGPWKLHGLPGLILQAYDQSGNIWFSAKYIKPNNIDAIGHISLTGNVQAVNLKQYKNILKHYKSYQKENAMKLVRQIHGISKKELANMTYHLQDVKHMEIFGKNENN